MAAATADVAIQEGEQEVGEEMKEELKEEVKEEKKEGKRDTYGYLEHLVSHANCSLMRPLQFFVSWSGVITLAYKGFSVPLSELKKNINQSILSLPNEHPGSRWPKTSLGALPDGARLSPDELLVLLKICREESGKFINPRSPRSQAVLVDELTVVFYECRCLERQLSRRVIPLSPLLETSEAPPEELENTQRVMDECDMPGYWYHASKDGSREGHYRHNALGVTLVHELACFRAPWTATSTAAAATVSAAATSTMAVVNTGVSGASSAAPSKVNGAVVAGDASAAAASTAPLYGTALPDLIRAFRRKVDAQLPGLYTWFTDESLHITVRALMG